RHDTETTKHKANQWKKHCNCLLIVGGPAKPTQFSSDEICQKRMEHVRSEERYPRAHQPKIPDTPPSESQTHHRPGDLAYDEEVLFSFCHNDEAHWPANHLQERSYTEPAQHWNGGTELSAVEYRHNCRGEGQSGNDARSCQ